MKHKISNVIVLIFMLPFLAVLIYASVCLLKDISFGKVLVLVGIYIMFGLPTIYFLGGVIASFCGRKTIAKIVSCKCSGNRNMREEWQVGYAFRDNYKIKFGTKQFRRKPTGTLMVRTWWLFHDAVEVYEFAEDEYMQSDFDEIEIKEMEQEYQKHIKKFWTITPLCFFLSVVLILVGSVFV